MSSSSPLYRLPLREIYTLLHSPSRIDLDLIDFPTRLMKDKLKMALYLFSSIGVIPYVLSRFIFLTEISTPVTQYETLKKTREDYESAGRVFESPWARQQDQGVS